MQQPPSQVFFELGWNESLMESLGPAIEHIARSIRASGPWTMARMPHSYMSIKLDDDLTRLFHLALEHGEKVAAKVDQRVQAFVLLLNVLEPAFMSGTLKFSKCAALVAGIHWRTVYECLRTLSSDTPRRAFRPTDSSTMSSGIAVDRIMLAIASNLVHQWFDDGKMFYERILDIDLGVKVPSYDFNAMKKMSSISMNYITTFCIEVLPMLDDNTMDTMLALLEASSPSDMAPQQPPPWMRNIKAACRDHTPSDLVRADDGGSLMESEFFLYFDWVDTFRMLHLLTAKNRFFCVATRLPCFAPQEGASSYPVCSDIMEAFEDRAASSLETKLRWDGLGLRFAHLSQDADVIISFVKENANNARKLFADHCLQRLVCITTKAQHRGGGCIIDLDKMENNTSLIIEDSVHLLGRVWEYPSINMLRIGNASSFDTIKEYNQSIVELVGELIPMWVMRGILTECGGDRLRRSIDNFIKEN